MDDAIVESVLRERYYQPNEKSWEDVCRRVANALFDENDPYNETVYKLHSEGRFILNSPALMNLGTPMGNCSACYVLPIKDDMSDIFETLRKSALIFKSGGGVGINFSTLRPKGAVVNSTNGSSSGVMQFIEVYNTMVETVKSAGKRRGAAIAILNDSHPDLEEFIEYKNTEGRLSNFNISVLITNEFINAAKNDEMWDLKHNGIVYKTVKAKDIFNKIVNSMWTRSEPGILFYNTINTNNCLVHEFGPYTTCNPCGEQILGVNYENGGGESCNLGSFDLSKAVKKFGDRYIIDYDYIENIVNDGIVILNKLLDINRFPVESIGECSLRSRKIGLGIMGLADMLIKLGISYGSKEGRNVIDCVMKYVNEVAYRKSVDLANEFGAYPAWDGNQDNYRRNACILNVPPTGSISLFANCSSGLEPNFGWVINRSTWVDGEKKTYKMIHPLFDEYFKNSLSYDKIMNWAFDHGTIQNCPYVDGFDKSIFQVAKDISPMDHVLMQASVQKWIDSSCSKTINCPDYTTEFEISDCIFTAWKLGCKGLTIYREGSRNDVVLETNATKPTAKVIELINPVEYKLVTANGRILPKTPRRMSGSFAKIQSGCGKLLIGIAESQNSPHTVIVENLGGGCESLQRSVAKLTALALRWNIPSWDLVSVLKSETCPVAKRNKKAECNSCSHALGLFLEELLPDTVMDIPDKVVIVDEPDIINNTHNLCPECGESLIFESGCRSCQSCGYSRCS